MLMVPYRADVAMQRWPYSNWAIIIVCIIVSILVLGGLLPDETIKAMILNGWAPSGLFGHMWLHAGILHLAGNVIFLWVFGNAVCAKVGNIAYPFVYVGLGLVAASADQFLTPGPAVGASGAINGIVGMFLVFYPLNDVSLFYAIFFFFFRGGVYTLSSMWVIFLWVLFDLWGLLWSHGTVGYAAHIGGFLSGVALAILLLKTGLIRPEPGERTLFDLFGRRRVYPMAGRMPESIETIPQPPPPRQPGRSEAPLKAAVQEVKADYLTFSCPCGKTLRTSPSHAGRQVRCPMCARIVQIPRLR